MEKEESRIVKVISKIINDKNKITTVICAGMTDYWFLYENKKFLLKKNKWGIDLQLFNKGEYTLEELAELEPLQLDRMEPSAFSSADSENVPHRSVFEDLLNVIKYKNRDFDDDLSGILSGRK